MLLVAGAQLQAPVQQSTPKLLLLPLPPLQDPSCPMKR